MHINSTAKSGNFVRSRTLFEFFFKKNLKHTYIFFQVGSCLNSGPRCWQGLLRPLPISRPHFLLFLRGDEVTPPSGNFVRSQHQHTSKTNLSPFLVTSSVWDVLKKKWKPIQGERHLVWVATPILTRYFDDPKISLESSKKRKKCK
jgi:hypothetical protein